MAYPPPPPPPPPPSATIINVQPTPPPRVLTKCSHCGSVFDLTLGRCDRCGAPVLTEQRSAPPSKKRRVPRWVYAAIAVAVVAAVVGSILWYEYAPGGPQNPFKVHITEVDWLIDSQPYETGGPFTLKGGSTAELSIGLNCEPVNGFFGVTPQTCSSGSVTIETPGFSLINTNAPFTWSSGYAGQGATVDVWIHFPNHDYTGALVINLE